MFQSSIVRELCRVLVGCGFDRGRKASRVWALRHGDVLEILLKIGQEMAS